MKNYIDSGSVKGLAISPDGRLLAKVGTSPGLAVFDLEGDDGQGPKTIKELKAELHCCAFSPDGRYLAVGGKTIKVYELPKFKSLGSLKVSKRAHVSAMAWSPDSTRLAATAEVQRHKSDLVVWEVSTDKVQKFSSDHFGQGGYHKPNIYSGLQFSPDGNHIAAAAWGSGFGVFCFDYDSDKVWRPLRDQSAWVDTAKNVAWRCGGEEILFDARATSGDQSIIDEYVGRLVRWRREDNSFIDVPTPQGYKFWRFIMHPDEEQVLLYLEDKEVLDGEEGMFHQKSVALMSLTDGSHRRLIDVNDFILGERNALATFCVSPDGGRVAVANRLGFIGLFDVK